MNKRHEGELYKRLKEKKKKREKQHVDQVFPYGDLLKKSYCRFLFPANIPVNLNASNGDDCAVSRVNLTYLVRMHMQ